MTSKVQQPNETCLDISAPASVLPRLALILQNGFQVRARVGGNIRELLCTQLGLPAHYVEDRIRTLFLDGHPVDDMDHTVVEEGSVVGLSGALPGLLGATMRRGGYYGCLRDSITYRPATEASSERPERIIGIITIKLFNLVLKDLGPHFLSQGVLLPAKVVASFFRSQPSDIWAAAVIVRIDGQIIAAPTELQMSWPRPADTIRLQVSVAASD